MLHLCFTPNLSKYHSAFIGWCVNSEEKIILNINRAYSLSVLFAEFNLSMLILFVFHEVEALEKKNVDLFFHFGPFFPAWPVDFAFSKLLIG